MAQSGYTPLLVYGSSTAAAEPTAPNLTSSANGAELALNYADGKLFYKNSGGNVRLLAIGYGASTVTPTAGGIQYGTGTAVAFTAAGTAGYILQSNGASAPSWVAAPSTSPGGSTTQVQYNNAGAFAGSANFTFDGTNVGIGVTPNGGWGASKAIQFENGGSIWAWTGGIYGTNIASNVYVDSATTARYLLSSVAASRYQQSGGVHSWYTAASGTAGNPITFTQAMTLDASGNLGIGTSSPATRLDVRQAGVAARFTSTNGNVNQVSFSNSATAVEQFYMGSPAANVLQFTDSTGSERMRITSAGLVGIGTTTPNTFSFNNLVVASGSANAGMAIYGTGQTTFAFATGTSGSDSYRGYIQYTGGGTDTMTFGTVATERMRIDSAGNVGIGVTPPTVSQGRLLSLAYSGSGISVTSGTSLDLTNNAYYNTAWKYGQSGKTARLQLSDDLFIFYSATTGTAGNNITFSERARISAAGGFSVGTTADPGAGAIYATGAITAYYSDARLKDVKGTITNALNKVSSLSGVYYTNNEVAVAHGYTSAETQVGLLAQDVEAVLPEVVKAAPFDLDEHGNSKSDEHYKTIQYERVIPLLVEAIKELRAEVQALRG